MNPASMTFEERLGEVFQRALPKLGPDARDQLAALISPESLAIIAGVLVAWVVGHAFGIGEVVDIIIGVVGFFSIGVAIFSGIDEIYEFAKGTYNAKSDGDLDRAASHLAKGISILGIQAVLAMLFKGRPKGGRANVGRAPPRGTGLRYEPKTTGNPRLPAGTGGTSAWGDIEYATSGSLQDQRLVLLHEKVHQFLTPKLYILRQFRVENRFGSYFNTSLYRYIEEALAETIAQIGVEGFAKVFVGLKFPVQNGYVFITRGGGYSASMGGAGLLAEGAALIATGAIGGFAYKIWFKAGVPN